MMAHWDAQQGKIIHWPEESVEGYPDWEIEDCGCSGGLEWGGEYPTECRTCKGGGVLYHHKPSGVRALYPGGPFLGRWKD